MNNKNLKRFLRKPLNIIGLFFILIVISGAIFGPYLSPYDPLQLDAVNRLKPPSASHPFGTDDAGRDILSRVLAGARISLAIAPIVVIPSLFIGVLIGVIAAYKGGLIDVVLMRFTDVVLSFPKVILAMAVVSALGPGIFNAVLAVVVLWWPSYARLARALLLTEKGKIYVEAARSIGCSDLRIVVTHIARNCVSPFIVKMTMDSGMAILTTASLSFLGLGAQPPTPEWGAMVAVGRTYIHHYFWVPTFPGLAIFIVVLGFSLLGDGLRDELDPRTSL